jgi:uncharacterized membrane protein (DUF4010 family)
MNFAAPVDTAAALDPAAAVNTVFAFRALGVALLLGLLVGMQRERVAAPLAGVRTFALITLLGTLCGLLARVLGPWPVAAGFLGVAAASAVGNALNRDHRPDPGITTEIAVLLMYAVGAYLAWGPAQVAVVLAGGVAVLLHFKPALHGFVTRLGETDMRAMMQFVLITLVILPVVPDRGYGPFQVLNPREIWWMVVLVVSISLGGYIALKLYGQRTGAVLGGLIGGLVSSTATTVSYARQATDARGHLAAATLAVMLASTVVYVRVLVEVAIVARAALLRIAPPIAIMLAVAAALCVLVGWTHRKVKAELPATENPTELRSAIVFGALYGLVVLAVAAGKHWLGDRGIFVVAAVSGLTDMDAITLSTSRMAASGALATETTWRAIVIATIANLACKAGIVALLGGPALFRRIAVLFGIQASAGIALLLLWPA